MQALRAGTLETREILKMQLSKENLSKEERSELNNMLLEVLRMEYEKDTENKKHGQGILKTMATTLIIILGIIRVSIGANAAVRISNDRDDNCTEDTIDTERNEIYA